MGQEDILRYENEQLKIEVRKLRAEKTTLTIELNAIQLKLLCGGAQ